MARTISLRPRPRGRGVEKRARDELTALLRGLPARRDLLIEALHRVQDAKRCISVDHVAALAEHFGVAQAEVFEVASFYHHFDLVRDGERAPPPVTVRICTSLSCALAGGAALLDAVAAQGADGVRVVPASCIGQCDRAPAALVGRDPIGEATPTTLLAAARADPAPCAAPTVAAGGRYDAFAECVAGRRSADDVIAALEAAGLRGLGGAGFPAHRKWRAVRAEPGPRHVAVNVDEGEPGTFKDRVLVERDSHAAIEGALVAAWTVGADDVWFYVRDEYRDVHARLAQAIADLEARPPGPLPRLHLRRGAGAYICGEESAMIESIEGKRGLPRLRPPYVAQRGLFGRPTLEQNLETLWWVPTILREGGAAFARRGLRGNHGVRTYSVSGRVRRPGAYVAPIGITARALIDEHAGGMADGHTLYAFLPGGASGGILPAALADVPLDFDALAPHGAFAGSGAVIVLSQHDRATDAARNVLAFFRDESCGQCTPCRAGTAKAVALMRAARWDEPLLEDLCRAMADASICGLGQAAPNPIRAVRRHFPHELA
ncbi:MAG TPA: NADH-ubiquinone oxidoreductase-F iron-sulfur binding region domain-containing protein [Casimicrobiaceae bacterium]|nr:NADH-ubiquinone oxidoreductase-F iron-sulfur binding region domain-containing protein [Casimicrobiaceae bacterium]